MKIRIGRRRRIQFTDKKHPKRGIVSSVIAAASFIMMCALFIGSSHVKGQAGISYGYLGFLNLNLDEIRTLCADRNIPYTIVDTSIAQIVFEDRKEDNPCSLCAKMRKGALNDAIKAAGCNKIAYAHHEDDVVETMMLSLFYEGRLHTFSPVTHLDKTDLTVIRPLIYMRESEVIGFVHKYQIPVVKSPCPADGHTRREYVKELLGKLNRENPGVKDRIFTAIQKGNMEGWTDYFGSH